MSSALVRENQSLSSPSGVIGRRAYVLNFIKICVMTVTLYGYTVIAERVGLFEIQKDASLSQIMLELLLMIPVPFVCLFILYAALINTLKRARDIGGSAPASMLWVALSFVPVLGLGATAALLFKRGQSSSFVTPEELEH